MNNANNNKITCASCGRQFRTGSALAEHTRTMHQNGSRGRATRRTNGSGALVSKSQNYDGTSLQVARASQITRGGVTATGIQEAVAQIIGATPDGRAWAMAALHPCGAGEVVAPNVGQVNGMCDTMTSAVATPVYRGETHITYSPTLFATPPTGSTTYGVDIVIPPIPEIDFMYRLIDDATNQVTGWVVVRQPSFTLSEPAPYSDDPDRKHAGYKQYDSFTTMASIGYGKVRQIGVGHTIELDAAGLNNQGRVTVGQMEGQWRNIPLNSPRIDQTKTYFVTDVEKKTTALAVTDVDVSGSDSSCSCWLLEVPTDPAVITSNCPNAYQGLAKEGAYIVQKFTSPLLGYAFKRTASPSVFTTNADAIDFGDPKAHQYLPSSAFAIDTSDSANASLHGADSFWSKDYKDSKHWSAFGQAALPIAVPGNAERFVSQDKLHPGTSEPSDMMVSVATFRNLPAGNSSGITASLRVKSRNYIEAISNGTNAAVAPYIHPPASFDMQALNSVIIAGKQLADAYPARANSLGEILGNVWNALKQYVRPIASTVGDLQIPLASGVAKMIEKGIGMGTRFEQDLAKRGFGDNLFKTAM